jgi:hypothetical protein
MKPAARKDKLDKSTVVFGKHKGKKWSYVIVFDPSYILWAYKHVKNFSLDSAIRHEFNLSKSDPPVCIEEADKYTTEHILANEYLDDEFDADYFDIETNGRFFGDS